ncbi:MAG: putative deoxyribonuclease YjjV [bacterium ADurb.Bin429]|nr:MAG: putative deoxyribonuclease YjjV [bacterium ADurb.Bin429]
MLKGLRDIAVPGGIAHAFNGSPQQAQAFIALGFKLGFGGAVTYDRALQLRRPVDLEHFTPSPEVAAQINRDGKLRVSPENPRYLEVLATLLDLLEAAEGHVAAAATALGITTTNFINLLHRDPKLWTAALALRKRFGLGPLKT